MWAQGEFTRVRDSLEMALDQQVEWVGDHDIYALLADAAAQQHLREALQKYVRSADESANRYTHRLYQAMANRAWGVLHRLEQDFDLAETRLHQALEIFQALDCRWQTGRTLLELGETAAARPEVPRARAFLDQALAMFAAMSAQGDVDRVQTRLALLGGKHEK